MVPSEVSKTAYKPGFNSCARARPAMRIRAAAIRLHVMKTYLDADFYGDGFAVFPCRFEMPFQNGGHGALVDVLFQRLDYFDIPWLARGTHNEADQDGAGDA